MKHHHPILCAVLSAAMWTGIAGSAQALTEVKLDLSADPVGETPTTARFSPGMEDTTPQRISEKAENTVVVAENPWGGEGKVLKLTKNSGGTPRTPGVVFIDSKGDGFSTGIVEISFRASIDNFAPGPNFPGFERLLTVNLYNMEGQVFFNLGFFTTEETEGRFAAMGKRGGSWSLGQDNTVRIQVNIDEQTISAWVNDAPLVEDYKPEKDPAIRIVEFRDGTAWGGYDGQFEASLADVVIETP